METIKRMHPFLVFFFGLALVAFLDRWIYWIVITDFYFLANAFIVLLAGILLIVILISIGIKYGRNAFREIARGWSDYVFLFIAVFISLFIVFIKLKDGMTGRFVILESLMANVFSEGYFGPQLRSYLVVIYSAAVSLFNVHLTPLTLTYVNRIFSVMLLVTVFLIVWIITGRRLVAIFGIFAVSLSPFIQYNIISIETRIVTGFFVCLAVLLTILYHKKKDTLFLVGGALAVILAAYMNYEMTILLGLPFIFYLSLYSLKPQEKKILGMTIAILLFLFISLYHIDFASKNPLLLGDFEDNHTPFGLISKAPNIFIHNVITMDDFHPMNTTVTLFSYLSLAISMFFAIYLVVSFYKGKEPIFKESGIYLMALILLSCVFFQLVINVEGLRANWRYAAPYAALEVVICLYAICLLVDRLVEWFRLRRLIKSKILFIIAVYAVLAILLFIQVHYTFKLSTWVHTRYEPTYVPEASDMMELRQALSLDPNCKIVKFNRYFEPLDFYFGLRDRTILLGDLPYAYENARILDKSHRCFYRYEPYIQEEYYSNAAVMRLDKQIVDNAFAGCQISTEYESRNPERKFFVYRYSC
jgi:hypothetical protein